MTQLSIINDEISDNIDECISFCIDNNIKYLDLRSIQGVNLVDIPVNEITIVANKINIANLKVINIASPLFKWYDNDSHQITSKLDNFKFNPLIPDETKFQYIYKVIKICKIFKADSIRIFSILDDFKQNTKEFNFTQSETNLLNQLVNLAKIQQINICIENEKVCRYFRKDDIMNFHKLNIPSYVTQLLDIGNVYEQGEAFTLDEIKKFRNLDYAHLKDYDSKVRSYVPLGDGDIPYDIFLPILIKNNPQLKFSLETHCKEKMKCTLKSIKYFRSVTYK
jgi:L-ribulose-5-phosphate 3-epimerase